MAMEKGDRARERILSAARKVFAKMPYNVASLRMIAREGRFDHPLIRYYFPSKGALFAAVVQEISRELCQASETWFADLEGATPEKALDVCLDRVFQTHFSRPDALRTVVQNMPQIDRLDEIPGYEHIPGVFDTIRRNFCARMPLAGPKEEIDMFFDSFSAVVINFLGAHPAHAQRLGMSPDADEYRRWLKSALIRQFGPWLSRLHATEDAADAWAVCENAGPGITSTEGRLADPAKTPDSGTGRIHKPRR